MTCIISWTDGNRTLMACDSAACAGDHVHILSNPKILKFDSKHNSTMLIGICGRLKAIQALMGLCYDKIPKDTTGDPYLFVSQVIAPIIQIVLKENKLIQRHDNEEFSKGSVFLVAYKGRVFEIDFDFAVIEIIEEFNSIGSGSDYAKSAMTAVKRIKPDTTPEELINEGMIAAEKYSAGVRGPFKIFEIWQKIATPQKAKKGKKKTSR